MQTNPTEPADSGLDTLLAHGRALEAAGDLSAAASLYRQVLAQVAPVHDALAALCLDVGDVERGMAFAGVAAALSPSSVHALVTYGRALTACDRAADGAAVLERAVGLCPDDAAAFRHLGLARFQQGQLVGATAAFERCRELAPAETGGTEGLVTCLAERGLSSAARRVAARFTGTAVPLLGANCDPELEPEEVADAHFASGRTLVDQARRERVPYRNDRTPERRLRVGYVSPDLREHSVAYFLAPLLAAHDGHAVETFCYHANR